MKKKFFAYLIICCCLSCKKDSNQTNSITFQEGNGVSDIDGNFYPSVIIGNGQEWTTVNLKTSTFTNGDPITNAMSEVSWSNTNSGAWCYYNNDDSNNKGEVGHDADDKNKKVLKTIFVPNKIVNLVVKWLKNIFVVYCVLRTHFRILISYTREYSYVSSVCVTFF